MKATGDVKRPVNLLMMGDYPTECELPVPEPNGGSAAFLVVSLTGPPDEYVRLLEETTGKSPGEMHAIGAEGSMSDDRISMHTVANPGDMTNLSVEICKAMGEIDAENVYLYFSSVTAMLQYAELQPVYRFFNSLTGRIHVQECVGYFEVNPLAHDERTLKTIENVFDGSVGEDATE